MVICNIPGISLTGQVPSAMIGPTSSAADQTMKIRILGAGPAGLYFAALMKRLDPSHDIAIVERNPRDATWGFGVVFSDRALEFLRADDEALYQYLTPHLENWPEHHHRPQRHGDPDRRQRLRLDRPSRVADAAVRLRRAARREAATSTPRSRRWRRWAKPISSSGRTARSRGSATRTRTGSARRPTGARTGSSGTAAPRPSTA